MSRVCIMVLDSFGIGASEDAAKYGDEGANTFLHIKKCCGEGKADQANVRQGPLYIPNLERLGLEHAAMLSIGAKAPDRAVEGAYGFASELSFGKDTPSGHWEIAGVPALFDWGYFPPEYPSFPDELLEAFIKKGNLPGILGNKHASGTDIIKELGDEHVLTGKPIVYTSADSVFQIAAHEESFGLERLYEICSIARELVDDYNVGRVIARPFTGPRGNYRRTGNRRDLAVPAPQPTLLDRLVEHDRPVIAIGKIADIYAHRGITKTVKADGNMALFTAMVEEMKHAPDNSLVFVNFVDFDMLYGHRRDVSGYAHALEQFDARLPEFYSILKPEDLVIMTADHGCDPTWKGSDHTREHVPVLASGPKVKPGALGKRDTFADIGQTVAGHLNISPMPIGTSFIADIF